jgi:hypothetical protein
MEEQKFQITMTKVSGVGCQEKETWKLKPNT